VNFPAQLRTGLYAVEYARGEPVPRVETSPADSSAVEAYDVLLMQTHQAFVSSPETRDATVADNLKRALGLARLFAMRPSTRLVVFPEFFLQGSDGSHPHEYWERCGVRIPGPETAELAAFAKACNVYVCGAVLEYDPSWPRRYFNTSIIIDPQGEIVLRYRKLQCADLNGLLNITTPGNLYSAYVERYGIDALVPVIDTPIGRLGTLICFDSNWPELWRALALRGAEVICNPTSEIHSNRRPYWYQAKRAHAAEQVVYVASANAGSEQFFAGAPVTGMNRGHSALIDYHGELVACADGPGVIPLLGRVELGALRRARAARANDPAVRFDPKTVAAAYGNFPGFPLDCFLHTPMELASEGVALVAQQIEQLKQRGVFKTP
jgi:predicted amidohydrolase